MKLYRLYKTKEEAQKNAPEGFEVVTYRDRFIVVAKNFALVNFGIAVGTILTYIGGKL